MAPRASWKGYLKLSLVSCPVRLYPATSSSERVRFNQLHKDTHNRINMKPVDPELGLVERTDLVKGYEYEDKKYIIIEDSDLEAVRLESNHTLNIEAFVDASEVDVVYQDAPYYLAPDGKMAEETFIVLREAMREAGKVAIARLVLSSRERVVTIGARDKGMFVCTLRGPNEVRATATYFDEIPDGQPDAEMLQLAEALIAQKTAKFDPKGYEDRYETALMAMIKEKLKGHKPIIAADPQRGNVVNLMDALKQSLGQAKPAAPSKSKAPAEAVPAAEKPAAKAAGGRRAGAKAEIVTPPGPVDGLSIGLVGGLAGLPWRVAVREVARRGGRLHRGVTRQTGMVVFGRRLLARCEQAALAAKVAAARAEGRQLRSENGLLRLLAGEVATPGMEREALVEQSRLAAADLERLALFDAFEHDVAPFSFRDLILARKYAGLIAGGAGWAAIVRSVHRFGPAVSLTAKSLQVGEGEAIYACHGEDVSELDGQLLLGLGAAEEDADEVFARAEAAEAAGRYGEAAGLFGRCLAMDPGDAVAAFNRANCLRGSGRPAEAEAELVRALKLDPGFVEAWFNLAGLAAARGGVAAARAALHRAIGLDADYGDAVYNLASLEFEAGDLGAARRWWERYLELDGDSEWARTAARGLRYLDLAQDAAG